MADYPATEGSKTARSDEETRTLLAEARRVFDLISKEESEVRAEAMDDLHFYNGKHWPDHVVKDRSIKGEERIMITVNEFPTLVHQVSNSLRQNRPGINILPDGDEADVETAKMMRGYIRNAVNAPEGSIAIDTAVESACRMGWGYVRWLTEYESPESLEQCLRFVRVRNTFTVYMSDVIGDTFDGMVADPTGANSRVAFVTGLVPKETFRIQYPGASETNFDAGAIGECGEQWYTADGQVRVAEYWVVEKEPAELITIPSDGWTGFIDDLDPAALERIKADPSLVPEGGRRQSHRIKVCCYKITGAEVLDETEWLGSTIPIRRMVGDETDISGKLMWSGIVRHAKDPARMYDYWVTSGTEKVAMEAKSPWVMEEGQIGNHKKAWDRANRSTQAYLLYKKVDVNGKPAPPPQRQVFSGIPAGMLAMQEGAAQDMMRTTGVRFDATKSERIADESGIALQQLRDSTDLGSFHYHDNLARVLKEAGHIYLDVVPKLLAYGKRRRVVSIRQEDDSEERVMLNADQAKPVTDTEYNGQKLRSYNPRIGKYAAVVTIGPNFATKRKETSAGQMALLKVLGPEYAKAMADVIAGQQDWDGAEEIERRFAMMLPPGMLKPDMKDVNPQVQALIGQMQQQIQQMTQEREQMLQALNDKSTDQQLANKKIELDYEAKLQAIAKDLKIALTEHINEQLKAVHEQALEFEKLGIDRTRAAAQYIQAVTPEPRAQ